MKLKITLAVLLFLFVSYFSKAQTNCLQYISIQCGENLLISASYGSTLSKYTACKGSPVKLSMNSYQTGGTIRWIKDGKIIDNKSEYVLQVEEDGTYYGEIITTNCTFRTPPIELLFTPTILLTSFNFSVNNDICLGGKTYMQVYNNSIYSSFVNYQWLKDGKEIPNANKFEYEATSPGVYIVRGFVKGCSMQSNPITVKLVDWKNREVSTRYVYTRGVVGDKGKLKDTIYACLGTKFQIYQDEGNDYQWYLDNSPIVLEKSNRGGWYIQQPGKYYAKFTSRGGCDAQTKSYQVVFTSNLPKTRLDISPTVGRCDEITIVNSFGNIGVNEDDLNLDGQDYSKKIQWYNNGINLGGGTPISYMPYILQRGKSKGVYIAKFKAGGRCAITSKCRNP